MTASRADRFTLAIETSCDDTSAAVLRNETPISNVVSSQIDGLRFGGIVPELASRAHQVNILPVIKEALSRAGLTKDKIDRIAVTRGPGLIGSLLVGVQAAKALAFALDIPCIGVNHIEAHMLASFFDRPKWKFPFVALIVSGGHTLLVLAKALGRYEILGETADDAAGECFDKTARVLGILSDGSSAMAGPLIEKRARNGKRDAVAFPRPMLRSGDYRFSFSGLKTSVLNHVQKYTGDKTDAIVNDWCASFQEAVVEVLVEKSMQAVTSHGLNRLVLCGGVAANGRLRDVLSSRCRAQRVELAIPERAYCTDNAAMIGLAAYKYFKKGGKPGNDFLPSAGLRLV